MAEVLLGASAFQRAHARHATDYPAVVGSHMSGTDSARLQDLVAAISLRENARGTRIGDDWDPLAGHAVAAHRAE